MIKLCEEGYIMSMTDYPIYQKIPFDAPDDYRYPYINLDVFFKNKSSKNKFDILMYDGYANNRHIRLPLTESICKSICDHVKEKVSFIFNDTYNDTPCTDENIEKVLENFINKFGINKTEASYFISSDVFTTDMYSEKDDSIDIL